MTTVKTKTSGVYELLNRTTGVRYIGSSCDLEGRRRHHFKKLRQGKHANAYLQRSFNANGEAAFLWSVLLVCSRDNCILYEQAVIDFYGVESLFNIRPTADQAQWSDETKDKLRDKRIGSKNPFYGKQHTDEAKARIRAWGKGVPKSSEMRRKLSD